MATTVATLVAKLVADTSQFRSGLAAADASVSKSKKSMQGLRASALSMGKALAGGAALAGVALGARAIVDEMNQAAAAAAQTNAVLKSTGGIANVTAKEVRNLADSIAAKSGLDDDAIVSAQNLLLTFKNVRNEVGRGNDIFKRATKSAVDLSVAGFGDMSSTAKMLGKALNDPIVGMTALSRAGVTFTAQQKETIKGLVESGELLKAQKLMLKEVESQVGGSAKAYGNTLPGQIGKAKEALLNLGASIASALVGPLTMVAKVVKGITDVLDELGLTSTVAGAAIGGMVAGPVGAAIGGFVGLASSIKVTNGAADGFKQSAKTVKTFGDATNTFGEKAFGASLNTNRLRTSVDTVGRSSKKAAAAAREHANELKKLNDEATKIINAQLGLQGALLNVEGSAKTYTDTVAELGANSLEARTAQHALQGDVIAAGQAALDASGKTQDQITTLNFLKGTLDGPAAAAINAHTLRVLGIPESKITSITADPTQAQTVIDTWIATNANREVPIRIAISNFGSALQEAAAGIGARVEY